MRMRMHPRMHPCYIVCESKRLLYRPLCLPPGSICSLNMSHGLPQHLDQDEVVCIMRILSSLSLPLLFPTLIFIAVVLQDRREKNVQKWITHLLSGQAAQHTSSSDPGHPVATHPGQTHTGCWTSCSPRFPSLAFCLALSAARRGASRCRLLLCQRYHPPWLTESPLPSCEPGPITWIM